MTIESVKALMFRCNSRAKLRSRIGSWAILGLMFVVAASVPGASASTASRGRFGAPATQTSPNRLFYVTGGSQVVSIDVATGETQTWPLDTGEADAVDWDRGTNPNIAVAQDGHRVAYATRKDMRPWKLRVTDGVQSKEIGSLQPLAWVSNFAWSPDDSEIAFLGSFSEDSFGEHTVLMVMNVTTGEIEYVTEPALRFTWQPHSREILYSGPQGAAMGIYWVDEKRETFRRLAHFTYGFVMTVSPDGARLLFDPPGKAGRMAVLDLANRQSQEMDTDVVWGLSGWSPQSDKLVAVRGQKLVPCGNMALDQGELTVVDIRSGEVKAMEKQAIPPPAWSPSKNSIAYLRPDPCPAGTVTLVVQNLDSGEEKVLDSGLSVSSSILAWR